MDNEEKMTYRPSEHGNGQPRSFSTTFAILLCIYFSFVFVRTINGTHWFGAQWKPNVALSDYPVFSALLFVINFLWNLYGIWAVVLSLKGSDYAVKSLKMCLFGHFVSFSFNAIPGVIGESFGAVAFAVLISSFPLLFLIYVCRSKALKIQFPVSRRKLGVPGVAGILLYCLFFIMLGYVLMLPFAGYYRSRKVETEGIRLMEGELTDGRVVFTPEAAWVKDSSAVIDSARDAFYFHEPQSGAQIRVTGATEKSKPARYTYLQSIYGNQMLGTEYYVGEVGYSVADDRDYVIYVDQYRYRKDSTDYYWTYATRLAKRNLKSVSLAVLERDSLRVSAQDAVGFLNGVTFDLKGRLFKNDGINGEKGGDGKDEKQDSPQAEREQ